MMVPRGAGFGEVVRHEGRTLMKGTGALYKKRPKRALLPLLPWKIKR